MNRNLLKSGVLSVGLHALLAAPLVPGAVPWSVPSADVLRGFSSVELELLPEEGSPGKRQEVSGDSSAAAARSAERGKKVPPPDSGALSAAPAGSLQNRPPVYPRAARVQGWEGRVLVRAWVTPSGGAASVQVARSSGREVLDRAAAAAVRRWRFRPARKGGRAVASQVEVPITFRLEQQRRERWSRRDF